jgi:hypothetical protein
MTPEPPKIIQLDEIEAIPGPGSLTWRPVRWLYYAAACLEAVQGNREAGLGALRQAVALRPSVAGLAKEDEDFASLRDDPEFRSLVDG